MFKNNTLKNFCKILAVNLTLLILFRLAETFLVFYYFGSQKLLVWSEILGLFYDIISSTLLLLLFYPFYYIASKKNKEFADKLFLILISICTVLSLIVINYFLYRLEMLDIFLFQYTLKEVLFTIRTSDISYFKFVLSFISLIALIVFSNKVIQKINFNTKIISYPKFIIVILLLLFILIHLLDLHKFNIFSINKPLFFYSRSLTYFLTPKDNGENYTSKEARLFQESDKQKLFINQEFPLLHNFDTTNFLGNYFNKFEKPPNIVILIIEGLNDDFIHDYKGVKLMPFLKGLKEKSLYWKKCFTLGERSFAVVPSLLGSLPYGDIGFTLLNKLPRHISLVSILHSNNYFTSFFYGQGAWFHQKDRFFKHNNIDILFDNSSFSEKYKKIIVGDDNFFWGYNDKDLFNQSLEVSDTIKHLPRMDIIFTGTSHAPFVINDKAVYDSKFDSLLNKIEKQDTIKFFKIYKKYIQTVLFVDDALMDFFSKYQKRQEYNNTVFIITGDHPMTEIPPKNSLKRYHVPLIIFSEMLKKNVSFSNPVSHLDFFETLLTFLKPYIHNFPSMSVATGNTLFFEKSKNERSFAFMNGIRQVVDYYHNGYYLSGEQLFKVNENFDLEEIYNITLKNKLNEQLMYFNKTNIYVSIQNKIIPDSIFCKTLNHRIIASLNHKKIIKFNDEYHNIITGVMVDNKEIFYEIDFFYEGDTRGLTLVYQTTSLKDSIILWRNFGLSQENKFFQAHFIVPSVNLTDTTTKFSTYFWNQKKKNIEYSDLQILIHQNKYSQRN